MRGNEGTHKQEAEKRDKQDEQAKRSGGALIVYQWCQGQGKRGRRGRERGRRRIVVIIIIMPPVSV